MIKVNLLSKVPGVAPPRDWIPKEQRSALLGLGMLLVTAVGLGGWWMYLSRQHSQIDTKIAAAEAELVRLKEAAQLVERQSARKGELAERVSLIERLRATKRGPVNLLETVSFSLPDGLWLTEIKQVGTTVQIEGRALSLNSVTDFAELLQNSGTFNRPVEIMSTANETVEDHALVKFQVKAEAPPAAPAANAAPAAPAAPKTAVGAPITTATPPPAPAGAPGGGSPSGAGS